MPVAPSYDVQKAVDVLFQGLVTQANLLLAATERYQAKAAPLEASDVPGILARANVLYPLNLPAYPRWLRRWCWP